jgi:carbamoyl-phosphate synthase large subunit
MLVGDAAEADAPYRPTMDETWAAINALRARGVADEFAAYLLPNAVAIRFTESADLLNLHHKFAMRLCYNAQEEIWRASRDEALQIAEVDRRIGRYLQPPCTLRKMAGESLASFALEPGRFAPGTATHTGVKEAVFPFARFGERVDTVLGPEMKSTGEVMGLDRDYAVAFAKSQLGGGARLPKDGTVFVSVRDGDKPKILESLKVLRTLGFEVVATSGTQRFLAENGVAAVKINKVAEGRPHIVDAIKNGRVQLVFNTTEGATALADSRSLRRAALLHKVPYYTTLSGAVAAAQGIKAYLGGDLEVRALQSYFGGPA